MLLSGRTSPAYGQYHEGRRAWASGISQLTAAKHTYAEDTEKS